MFFEHLDIDAFGPHQRVSLGPFSPGLNVIFGDPGSGKSAIVAFVRSIMLGGGQWNTSTAGRVVWSDQDGLVVCRREVDGSSNGILRMERLSRDGRTIFNDRPILTADRLPPSWLDGIVAPSRVTAKQIRAVLRAAERIGLEVVGTVMVDQPEIRLRYDEVSRELAGCIQPRSSVAELEQRRNYLLDLVARRVEVNQTSSERHTANRRRVEEEYQTARREIAACAEDCRELERSRASVREELARLAQGSTYSSKSYSIKADDRSRLEQLDDRLMRWRRTLSEVRALRDQICDRATDERLRTDVLSAGCVDPRAVDQPLRAAHDHLEDIRRRMDWIADRYGRDLDGSAYEIQGLLDVLRSARADLQAAQESLSHRQSLDHTERYQNHASQLARCESELLAAIDRLISQRAELLRRLADKYHLSPEQLADAFGNWQSCEDHPNLYDWLFSSACPPQPLDREAFQLRYRRLEGELADLEAELARSHARLENARRDAAHWEAERERLDRLSDSEFERLDTRPGGEGSEAYSAELAEIETALAHHQRRARLLREHEELAARLAAGPDRRIRSGHFCQQISHWLHRLSDGQLRQFTVARHEGTESIDGRSLDRLTAPELECVSLATRLAVADTLAAQGRPIPLLIDDPHERLTRNVIRHAAHGRQIVLLTKRRELIDNVLAAGGKSLNLQPQTYRRVQTTRYEPRYALQPETYSVPQPLDVSAPTSCRTFQAYDVNQELDTAWREVYGLYDSYSRGPWNEPTYSYISPSQNGSPPNLLRESHVRAPYHDEQALDRRPYRVPVPTPITHYDPDSYHVDTYRVRPRGELDYSHVPLEQRSYVQVGQPASDVIERRFFLSEESPVDQAPSVDAMIASRLRGLGLHRVGELISADSGLLAERLCLPNVTRDRVRQWQDEARLVCTVPHLRPFDARVLIGCGVNDSQQLAAMHPSHLLRRVQAFLATDRGRHILSSGSSYELSRITNWIVSAGRIIPARATVRRRRLERDPRRVVRARRERHLESTLPRSGDQRQDRTSLYKDIPYVPTERRRSRERVRTAEESTISPLGQSERSDSSRRLATRRVIRSDRPRSSGQSRRERNLAAEDRQVLKFYLSRQSPVVDAPTIGPSTAKKLIPIGIRTVGDLLDASAERIAADLGHSRITAEVVRQWQREASFVCRVPNLRGHDAQILVASGIHEPEELSRFSPRQLLERVAPFFDTVEGRRVLRGNTPPDLDEVTRWIEWSRNSRNIAAA